MAAKKRQRHASGVKAYRQSERRRVRNRGRKKAIRLASRAVSDAAEAKDSAKVSELLPLAMSSIDKAARNGTIHWKTAARKKSRLAKRAAAQLTVAAKA